MREYLITQASMSELLRNLTEDLKTFWKQEIKLVDREVTEKVSQLRHGTMMLGIGNLVAGAGGILLLASIGFLLAYAFQKHGMNMLLALFLGFAIVGIPVAIIGAVISLKGIKTISISSLKPQRTIQTVIGEIPGTSGGPEPDAAELHGDALAIKHRIEKEGQELTHRLAPAQLKKAAIDNITKHPFLWSAGALACALTGGYFVSQKFRRAWQK